MAVNAFFKDQRLSIAQPFLEIVASQDQTRVTISPTAAIVGGGGVAPTGKGQPQSYMLDQGQVLQFTQDAELTGSAILSDKPVGVWGGATCLDVDVSDSYCDSAHQQLFPVKALGHEYAAVRYRNRYDGKPEESVPWRFVGAVDGTTLSYDPATPQGAPTSLSSGQVAQVWSSTPFVVRSQDDKHPFYLSGHMTGAARVGPINDGRGDPEFVNIIPPQEYLASYVFFTDPTYPETDLVLVRTKGPNGFADVTLDCAGTLAGWTPLGSDYEYTRVDLVRHDFQPQGGCNNGRHEISSTVPFGLTVWGWGSAETGSKQSGIYSQFVSYAYPGGASVLPINAVVVPPTPK